MKLIQTVETACHLNLAMVYLRTEHFHLVIYFANEILKNDPHNWKARSRKSIGHFKMGELKLARDELVKALYHAPED